MAGAAGGARRAVGGVPGGQRTSTSAHAPVRRSCRGRFRRACPAVALAASAGDVHAPGLGPVDHRARPAEPRRAGAAQSGGDHAGHRRIPVDEGDRCPAEPADRRPARRATVRPPGDRRRESGSDRFRRKRQCARRPQPRSLAHRRCPRQAGACRQHRHRPGDLRRAAIHSHGQRGAEGPGGQAAAGPDRSAFRRQREQARQIRTTRKAPTPRRAPHGTRAFRSPRSRSAPRPGTWR